MNSSEIRDFVLPTAPARTLWFEFLFVEGLLETHLSSQYCDPTPNELIISFLSNATTSPSGDVQTCDGHRECILKTLAVKVACYFNWNIDFIDKLPLPMQQTLFETLKRLCTSDPTCPPSVAEFAEISYQRWVIRSLTKSTYPTKNQNGLQKPINLVQQGSNARSLDPTYTPLDVMQNIISNLNREVAAVITSLESKLSSEGVLNREKHLLLPNSKCFTTDGKGSHNWSEVLPVNCSQLSSTVRYELGCYFFIREPPSYQSASNYFDSIPQADWPLFQNIHGYHSASRGLSSSEEVVLDDEPDEASLKTSLDRMFAFQTCDLSFLETSKLKPSIVSHELSRYKSASMTSQQSHLLRAVTHYLCNKIPGLSDEIFTQDEVPSDQMDTETSTSSTSIDSMADEVLKVLSVKEDKKPEITLITSTDLDEILDAKCNLTTPWNQINCKWKISPLIFEEITTKLPAGEANQDLAVIAKAGELRSCGFYSESRSLFLSLEEGRQALAPELAKLISYEKLQTDLECQERVGRDLIERSIEAILDQREIVKCPSAVELAATFLLDHQPAVLRDLIDHPSRAVRLASLLSGDVRQMSPRLCKDIWDCIRDWLRSSESSFIEFVKRLNCKGLRSIIASCLVKMYNLIRDTSVLELTTPLLPSQQVLHWPSNLQSNQLMPPLVTVANVLDLILERQVESITADGIWVRCSAELALCQGDCHKSMKLFLDLLSSVTQYFTRFTSSKEEDHIIGRLIAASSKLYCHTQAAVLQQMLSEPNYSLAFKSLSERSCCDSCDDLIECLWDVSLLEFLVTLYTKRGDIERKTKAVQLIGQLELNANNSKETLNAAAGVRQRRFFRILTKKYA